MTAADIVPGRRYWINAGDEPELVRVEAVVDVPIGVNGRQRWEPRAELEGRAIQVRLERLRRTR